MIRAAAARPRGAAEVVQRLGRVGDEHVRPVDRLADDRARRAGGEGLVDEAMTVGRLALQRDEQVARPDLARIEGDARRLEIAMRRVPPVASAISARGPQRAHAAHSRATATSSNGSTRSPTIWPCSWPLPASRTMSPAPASAIAARIASRRPADLARAGRAGQDVAPDRGRILAARIVVGDDDQVGEPRRDRAHLGALADVAVAAGAEHDDQPAPGMRPQRLDRRFDRVGRVRIIDIDRRAGAGDHRPLEPAAHRLDAAPDWRASASSSPPVAITSPAAVSALAA